MAEMDTKQSQDAGGSTLPRDDSSSSPPARVEETAEESERSESPIAPTTTSATTTTTPTIMPSTVLRGHSDTERPPSTDPVSIRLENEKLSYERSYEANEDIVNKDVNHEYTFDREKEEADYDNGAHDRFEGDMDIDPTKNPNQNVSIVGDEEEGREEYDNYGDIASPPSLHRDSRYVGVPRTGVQPGVVHVVRHRPGQYQQSSGRPSRASPFAPTNTGGYPTEERDTSTQDSHGNRSVPRPNHRPTNDNENTNGRSNSRTDVLISATLVESATYVENSVMPVHAEAEPMEDPTFRGIVQKNRRVQIWLCIGGIGLVVLSIIITLSFTLFFRSSSDRLIPSAQSAAPSPAPTSLHDKLLQEGVLDQLSAASRLAVEVDETSPQSRAYQWLESLPSPSLLLPVDATTDQPEGDEQILMRRYLQRYVMAVFFFSTQGNAWTRNDGWLTPMVSMDDTTDSTTNSTIIVNNVDTTTTTDTSIQECDWYGVLCDNAGRLTSLQLDSNSLSGTIPNDISLWGDSLRSLSLEKNNLFGRLSDSSLGKLTVLEKLNLCQNRLFGSLPASVGQLSQLMQLRLTDNAFTGALPTTLGQLSFLSILSIENNRWTGPLPTELGTIRFLASLHADHNTFTGSLPTELGLLKDLEELSLANNGLVGTIPTELRNMPELSVFDVGNNTLSGGLPDGLLSTSPQLYYFSVYGNNMLGSIPTTVGLAMSLSVLSLENNQNIVGPLPTQLGQLSSSLMSLRAQGNALDGTIPTEIGRLTSLVELLLQRNRLTGTIPSEIGLLSWTLVSMKLDDNRLGGVLPVEVCNLWNAADFTYGCSTGVNCTGCFTDSEDDNDDDPFDDD